MVHLMVDHFTDFAVTGESAASSVEAKKTVQIVAYVTPPEIDGDCLVRVYCVGDTPVHLEVCMCIAHEVFGHCFKCRVPGYRVCICKLQGALLVPDNSAY